MQYGFIVSVTLHAFGLIYPLYLNFVPSARRQVSRRGNALGLPRDEIENAHNGDDNLVGGKETSIRRMSRKFSTIFGKINVGGRDSGDETVVEHRERRATESSHNPLRGSESN